MKKAVALVLVLCLVCLMFAGCGGNGNAPASSQPATESTGSSSSEANVEPVTIEFLFGSQPMLEWFEEFFPDLISGDNPDKITVQAEFQKEATQILQMKAATNEIPDMVSLGLPQEMINQGKFLDLSEGPWWDNTLPSTKELSTDVKSGKVYTVPMGSGAVGIFYNTEILESLNIEVPETWEEFVAALEKVKAEMPDVTPMYMGGKESWSLGHITEFTLMGVAKQELGFVDYETAMAESDLEALGWNEDADGVLATFAKCMMELKEKELVNSNVVTATTDNLADAFVNGKAAFVSQGMWALATMQEKNPDFKSIGFMAYPSIMPDTKPSVGGPLEGQIAISASSSPEEIAAAKKVLERMTSPDAMKAFCEKNGTIPARTDVDANWSFIKDEVKEVLGSAQVEMFTQNLPGAFNSDEYGRLVQNIFVDKYATPEDFARDYLAMWNSAYEAANG